MPSRDELSSSTNSTKKSLVSRLVRLALKVFAAFIALLVLLIGRPFIDYLTISGSRLYAGFASRGLVAVIDTATNQTVASVDGLPRAHGVAVVPDRNLGFASASGDNTVGVFDLTTHRLLQKIPAGLDPDAIIYDEKSRLVYVGDHDGKTGTLIDPASNKVVASIALGGEPEYPQADPVSGLIYQNLEDSSEVVVVDPQKQAVTKRYKTGRRAHRPGSRCHKPSPVFRVP
jgi:YVTN family beta-propeller protein